MKVMMAALFCLVLCGCNLPGFFWLKEEEKIVDDIVEAEEKIIPGREKK